MTDSLPQLGAKVGIIAGGGTLPFAVADSLAARGVTPVLFALKGTCDDARVAPYRHHWLGLGAFGKLLRLLRSENCRDLVFIGSLVRPSLTELRLDWGALRVLPALLAAYRGGDDHLLTGVGSLFERHGFRLLGLRDVAPDLLMPEGCLTRAMPDSSVEADIAKGRALLAALSPFDIGQGCVVIEGHVVAVEDTGGTDELLGRIAQLRVARRISAKPGHGVLVKAPKAGQDLRFDLPALGPKTIEGLIAAQLGGVAVVAGHTVVAEPQAMIAAADRAGLFAIGLRP
ncbi:UDP-2,3-diacylglucosamine diphosphatase LpxI [Rhodopseudomonas sp. HC1]|uniref:LpxI family protein n=1 Tax=Rhodopseudomonas infernalis TaxID=2897386 RepID=UPI001EE9480F|nr:UDP-2,3-diacylglucosamine diphosphatase LpxI [Rhodopseudomonas infernalis]MCG6206891.1 UDP-2,3-diacylglucosamine diphosphatase LpxI [Rhodopseudomonas infernalis]